MVPARKAAVRYFDGGLLWGCGAIADKGVLYAGYQGYGWPSREKPPRGPSSGRVAAQTIPGTLSAMGLAPMVSAPGQVAVRSGSTALMMTGVSASSAARVAVRARRAALEMP